MQRAATFLVASLLMSLAAARAADDPGVRLHGIFTTSMVLQRDKPITIWGWAPKGQKVAVRFGQASAAATADSKTGRFEATFPPQKANATAQKLIVNAGDKTLELDNILTRHQGIWGNKYDRTRLHVWSPLVEEPAAVRDACARSPMQRVAMGDPASTQAVT